MPLVASMLLVLALARPERAGLADPAADCRWVDEHTLLVVPSGGGVPQFVDARTGARRAAASAVSDPVPLSAEPLRSIGGGRETSIRIINGTDGAVQVWWVDHAGIPRDYGSVPAGGERLQHTFEGHAWELRAADGASLGRVRGGILPVTVRADAAVPADPGPATEPHHGVPSTDAPHVPEPAAALAGPHLWSPDGAAVVAWESVPEQPHPVHLVESAPGDRVEPRLRTIQYLKPGDRIAQRWPRLFRADGTEVPLDRASFANPWSIDHERWSADGRTFTFLCNDRGHQGVRLLAVDAATGAVRTVAEERSATFVDYPNKVWLHWLGDAQFLWMSERSGWNHLYLVDAASGRVVRQVTPGPGMVRSVDSVDEAARTVTVRMLGVDPAQDPYHEHVLRVPVDGGAPVRLTVGDGTHDVAWSPGGQWYVDTWSRADLPPVHELRRASDGGLVCELGRADASALLADGWRMPERFVAKGRDGTTDIHGIIVRPRGHDGRAPLPVLECVYAGPHDFHVPKRFSAASGVQRMADAGFAVVQVDGMGTNWRGKAFHDVCWKNLKDAGFPDRKAWIRAAAASRPWMDLSRVGIYGGSAGGQNAMRALIDHHDLYRVAVADCGCHDNRMDKIWWNELWMGWPVDESYVRSSNVADAARLRGDLMLVVGELDENVDPASTMQASAALVRAGIEHELVVVPGAGHGAAETPYGSRKRLEFLRRHLQGGG